MIGDHHCDELVKTILFCYTHACFGYQLNVLQVEEVEELYFLTIIMIPCFAVMSIEHTLWWHFVLPS
jgi:hypothetical protein